MNEHILAAIRSQPWAIMPGYLEALEAIALRALDNPAVLQVERDGHVERQAEAVAQMGQRAPGTSSAALRDGVASLPIFGPIFPRSNLMTLSGATSLDAVARDLRVLQAMPEARQILFVMDTPGGAVTAVHEFGRMVASSTKPISVHVQGMCCSAGYWIGSQASGGISADPISIVGSIGVLMSSSVQETPDSSGRRAVDIASSNAPNKRPDLSTEEGRASVRAMIDAIETVFIADVARGRGTTPEAVVEKFGAGGTKTGVQAKEAGMVDRIEADGLEGAIRRLSKLGPSATSRRTAAATLELAQLRARNH